MTAEPAGDEGSGGSEGSSIEAHAVIPRPVADVWRVLAGPSGPEALLGPGATLGRKGEPWRSEDGTHLVNYVQWKNREQLAAAHHSPEFRKKWPRFGELIREAEPCLYKVEHVEAA